MAEAKAPDFVTCSLCISTGRHPKSTNRKHILDLRRQNQSAKKQRQRENLWNRKQREKEEAEEENEKIAWECYYDHYNKKHGFYHKSLCRCYNCMMIY